MHALTAAHKILPMQTKVRVTNLENGKRVIVRINDRGPFVKNRIIDLSYAAARKLGIVRAGTARVKVESLDALKLDIPGRFYIQTGSFKEKRNAYIQLARLKEVGYHRSRMIPVVIKGDRFWRVQAGIFNGLNAAERAKSKLERENPSSFIIAD